MKREVLRNLIDNAKGRIFTATFVKKDGEVRVMNCRTGVTKGTKGGRNNLEGKPNYVSVYDVQRKSYKTLNVDTLKSITIDGCTLYVQGA